MWVGAQRERGARDVDVDMHSFMFMLGSVGGRWGVVRVYDDVCDGGGGRA